MRLKLFQFIAGLFGINLTYAIRFIDDTSKRNESRGRTVFETDDAAEARARWDAMANGQFLKEKNSGIYYLAAETDTIKVLTHQGKPQAQSGGLFEALPGASENGPDASTQGKAAGAAQGAAGEGGAAGRLPAGDKGPVGDHGPVVSDARIPLSELGVRK